MSDLHETANETAIAMAVQADAELVISEVEICPIAKAQMDLEDNMIEEGKAQYWKLVGQAASKSERGADMIPARAAIRLGQDKLAVAIAEWVAAANAKRGKRPTGLRSISAIDPETVAHIAMRVLFNNLAGSGVMALPRMAIKLGIAICEEATMRAYEERHPAIVNLIRSRLESSSRIHFRRVLKASINRKAPDIFEANLPDGDYTRIGLPLIEMIEVATGLVKTTFTRSTSTVELSDECKKFFEDVHTRAQYFHPQFAPTITPPRPWSNFRDGGYHYGLAGKLTLAKTSDKIHRKILSKASMPDVYAGLNALQNTAWRINTDVLEVFDYAVRLDSGIGSLPMVGNVDIPQCPADIPLNKDERTEEQQERLDRWRRIAAAAYRENEERNSARHAISQTLSLAQRYAEYPEIFFPHTLDFRGRAYPVTSYLTPQGSDYQKAMIRFAQAKPMTLENKGMYWLSIHGANCMADCPTTGAKLDKGKLNVRNQWVIDNTASIMAVASNPLDTMDFWCKADAPWQFLAFCFEWAAAQTALASGRTPVSSLAVALDGSCNGLQHFSAMMRDEIGGAAVNLIPVETPADIYSEVKNATTEELVRLAALPEAQIIEELEDEEEEEEEEIDTGVEGITGKAKAKKKVAKLDPSKTAKAWIASGQIDRTMCKRPVMTTAYGSKKFGIKGQIMEELRKRRFKFEGKDGFAEAGFLSGVIVDAIGQVVVKAKEVMDWLQHSATIMTKAGVAIEWTAPSGFIVRQAYPIETTTQVKTFFHGQRFEPRLMEQQEGTLNRSRQTNGVSPNFVHSMDATAMILTVERLARLWGVTHFAMIHDSYGTHAADTQVLADVLRDVFIHMYTDHDPIVEYREEVVRALADHPELIMELEPLPKRGTLDLELVRRSDFFFA